MSRRLFTFACIDATDAAPALIGDVWVLPRPDRFELPTLYVRARLTGALNCLRVASTYALPQSHDAPLGKRDRIALPEWPPCSGMLAPNTGRMPVSRASSVA